MLSARRGDEERLDRPGMHDSRYAVAAHLRLFGLLALLMPLFGGLQYVVETGVPRVEVRLVTQDVETAVPVEVPVERVVERVVYVPVERSGTIPSDSRLDTTSVRLPAAPPPDGIASAATREAPPPSDVVAVAPEESSPAAPAVAEPPVEESAPVIGAVALAPQPVAPVVMVPRAAVTRPVAPPVVEPEVAVEEEELVEEAAAEVEDEPIVAEAPAPAADESAGAVTRVYVSEVPVVREDEGASIAMLRHELFVRSPQPPAAEEPAAAEAPVAETPSAVEQESEGPADESATVDETDEPAADEPAAEEGAAKPEDAAEPATDVESKASQPSTEELLSQAKTERSDQIGPGNNGMAVIAEVEHQLIARDPAPAPAVKQDEAKAEEESSEDPAVAEDGDDVARRDSAEDNSGEADELETADAEPEPVDVPVVADGQEGEPEAEQ